MKTLTPVERGLLVDLLAHGDNVPSNIADNTGYHEKSVCRSVSKLEDEKLVRNKGRGVYTLTHRGLEQAEELKDGYERQERIS